MSEPVPVAPFFILGCPRSGTTLLRRIFNAHSLVAIPPESYFVYEYLSAERVPLEVRKDILAADPALASWDLVLERAELDAFDSMAECIRFIHRKYAAAQGKPAWGHKTQTLIRHWETLLGHLPEARFLHAVRDPRAVVNSLMRSEAHRLNPLVGARRYNLDTQSGLRLERDHPQRTYRIRYEDLVARPRETIGPLCGWLGLDFEESMLDPESNDSLRMDAGEARLGHHGNVKRPIEASFSEKWRTQLSQRQIELIDCITRETRRQLGDDVAEAAPPPGRVTRARLRMGHAFVAGYLMARNLWARPHLSSILRRKWRLGTLFPAVSNLMRGR